MIEKNPCPDFKTLWLILGFLVSQSPTEKSYRIMLLGNQYKSEVDSGDIDFLDPDNSWKAE